MIIRQFTVGFLEVNNYLLIDEVSKEAVLIDCTEKNPKIDEVLEEYGAKLKYVLLTHGHFDHVLGVNDFRDKYKCEILIHYGDEVILQNIDTFMAGFGFKKTEVQKVDGYITDNELLKFGSVKIKVIHTPGHSPGAVCYLVEDNLFSGDTVFFESVGRTDLYGGNFNELKKNIEEKIFTLDENIKIYPGHGSSTTVGHEKNNNKFL